MKKAAVNIIVVTNDTSIASFVPTSAIQDGTAYAKYLRFSILLPFQINVVQKLNGGSFKPPHDNGYTFSVFAFKDARFFKFALLERKSLCNKGNRLFDQSL